MALKVALPGFDFFGDTVRAENNIMTQSGETFLRGSYFGSNGGTAYNGVTDFTDGAVVNLAVMLDNKLPSNLDMTNRAGSRDLIVGDGRDNTVHGAKQDDFLWGFGGDDILDGGAGNDFLNGGKDVLGDKMQGGDGDDKYVVNSPKDTVTEGAKQGHDTVVVEANGKFSFKNIERVEIDYSGFGSSSVRLSGNLLEEIKFDDQGGTITFALDAAPTERTIDLEFSAAQDIFVFDANGHDPATGVVFDGVEQGFFWGFEGVGIQQQDRIDLTDLNIISKVNKNITLASTAGNYLLKPGTTIDIPNENVYYFNPTSSWYFLDLDSGLFSPFISGNLRADSFII